MSNFNDPAGCDNLTELAAMLLEQSQELISFADTKAQLVLAADALFATAVGGFEADRARGLFTSGTPLDDRLSIILILLAFGTLLVSVYYALTVAKPNLTPTVHGSNLFFFGAILQRSENEFVDAFQKQSLEEARSAVLREVYAKSHIAARKFNLTHQSLNYLVWALVLWIAAQVISILG